MNLPQHNRRWIRLCIGIALLLLTIAVVSVVAFSDVDQLVVALKAFVMTPAAQTELFLLALIFLPLLGFPISLFYVMAGVKLGFGGGMAVIGVAMLCHLIACYSAMHSFIKPRIKKILERCGYQTPTMREKSQISWAVGFVAVPVFPYMVKNILVASGTLPLRTYLLINWPIQMIYSVPFVLLSGAARENNMGLMWLAAVIFLLFWGGTRVYQHRRESHE